MRTKLRMLVTTLLCFAFVFSIAACGNETVQKPSLTITSAEKTIEIGEKYLLEYTAEGADTVSVAVTEKDGKTGGTYSESSREFSASEAGVYTLTVTATNKAGDTVKSVTVTVKAAEIPSDTTAPVITIENKDEVRTVGVGQSITLPKATASDDTDGDLTEDIEVGMATSARGTELKKGTDGTYTFKADVAGTHKISYYVEDAAENYDEQFIDITVTPAKEETTLAEGENDISNLAKDNVKFTENFEDGYNGTFAKGLSYDTVVPAYISGTQDAIAGNSLILDYETCVSNTDTKFYFGAVQDYIKSGKWTVSMDVNILEGNLPDNRIYLFFVQEGQTEAQGIPFSVKNGEVTHIEYTAIKVFDDSKPWYMGFFTYTGNASFTYDGLRLAIDNISLTREFVEDATVVRTQPAKTITAEDLDGAGHTFTGDDDNYTEVIGSSNAIYLQKDKLVGGKYLTEEQFANITAENGFNGSTVIYTTGQQTGFRSIKDLCTDPAYDYTLTMRVYLPADISGWHFWKNNVDANMAVGGTSLGTIPDAKCKAGVQTWEITVQGASDNMHIGLYSGNQNSVYIGDVTISRTPHEVSETTPNGHSVGKTWTLTAANKPGDFNNVTSVVPFEVTLQDGSKLSEKEGFGDSALRFNKENDKTGEMFRLNSICESGCVYKITFVMYVDTITGTLMANFDNQKFPVLTSATGLQTVEIENEGLIDFFSLYVAGGSAADVYVASVTIELIEIK